MTISKLDVICVKLKQYLFSKNKMFSLKIQSYLKIDFRDDFHFSNKMII